MVVPTTEPPLNANTEEYSNNHIMPITEETPYVQVHTAETVRVVELECKCDFHPVSLVSMCLFPCTPGFVCVSFHMDSFVKACYSSLNSLVEATHPCQHASRLSVCICASSSLCIYVCW